jgi:beta-xylosidase
MRLVPSANCFPLIAAGVFLLARAIASDDLSSRFAPGEIWKDADGNPINAHGGGILLHQGVYYWYGESKSGRTFLPDCNKSWGGTRVDVTGISCYSSTNLYNWSNEGLALTAITNDVQHDLHPSKVVERPKVIYNPVTKKFVMWMHIDSVDYKLARAGVAISDRPAGPFKYLGSFRPNAGVWPVDASDHDKAVDSSSALAHDFRSGQMSRDLTVFVDDDAKAYLFYSSENNATMHISALTDDYLRPGKKYVRAFVDRSMEAPAVFKRAGKYYFIASGCTAWAPNAARMAVAGSVLGPWKELSNPCLGRDAEITFNSQSTFVLPNPHRKGEFIFMADRWNQWDLPDSRHVWLPLEFDSEKPVLRWRDRWALLDAPQSLRADSGSGQPAIQGPRSH